jgi:hypothetical protein
LNALYARAGLHNRITISYPQYQPLAPGNLELFRQHLLPLLNGTAWTKLPGARLTSFQADSGPSLKHWRDEANLQGFADRTFIYACDEPGTDVDSWSACIMAANDARQVWPSISTLITASLQNASRNNALETVDWLVALVNEMHDKPDSQIQDGLYRGNQRRAYAAFEKMSPRNEVWLYTSCMSHGCTTDSENDTPCQGGTNPPASKTPTDPYFTGWPGYVIDAPASHARAMGWLAFLYGAVGELYFQVDHCLASARTAQYAFGGNGDGTLFYHGDPDWIGGTTPVPIESIRVKQIRDGYEDFEYLKILDNMGKKEEANQIAQKLFPNMFSTTRHQPDLDDARTELARLIDPSRVP